MSNQKRSNQEQIITNNDYTIAKVEFCPERYSTNSSEFDLLLIKRIWKKSNEQGERILLDRNEALKLVDFINKNFK